MEVNVDNMDVADDNVDDLIAIAHKMNSQDGYDELTEQIERNQSLNISQTATDLRFIGDREIICQVVQLLAYIRNALKTGNPTHIDVEIGNEIAGPTFTFDVNGCEIKDITAVKHTKIN